MTNPSTIVGVLGALLACSCGPSPRTLANFALIQPSQAAEAAACAARASTIVEASSVATAHQRAMGALPDWPHPTSSELREGPDLPFAVGPEFSVRGVWSRQRVDNGYLVSLDRGEFGGGLWWLSAGGRVQPIIENRPVWRVGHSTYGPYALVLEDLDLTGEVGALVTLTRDPHGRWTATGRYRFTGVALHSQSSPESGVFIVTSSQFVRWNGTEMRVMLDGFAPGVMTRLQPFSVASDGRWIYVGMRLLLLRVLESEQEVEVDWFIPRRCVQTAGEPFRPGWCDCSD